MEDAIQAKELLHKLRNGTITEAEHELLEWWYLSWSLTGPLHLPESELEDLISALDKRIPYLVPLKQPVKLWAKIVSTAAVLFIAILFSVFYYNYNAGLKSRARTLYSSSRIGTGKSGGTLTLSDGRKILLNHKGKHELASEGTALIQQNSFGELVYAKKNGAGDKRKLINVLSTSFGQQCRVQLPDGTVAWLNAASTLTYPVSFTGDSVRKVNLTGEGYFEVSKDRLHPFIVSTLNQTVRVLGTHFNITAYPDDRQTVTTLLEGLVRVNDRILEPNQEAVLRNGSININNVNAENVISWKNGQFVFSDEPLEDIMKKICRWYGVKVSFEDTVDKNYLYGGAVSKYDNISRVMDKLCEAGNIHYKIQERTIYISK